MKNKNQLTILFDANPLVGNKTGVGYYTYELIEALAAQYPDDIRLIGHYFDFLGRKKGARLVRANNVSYRTTKLLPGKLFNGLRRLCRIEIPLELLARRKADVLLFPNFVLSPSLFRKPRVVTIHDLYFTEHPEHINKNNIDFLRKFVPKSIAESDLIITVSNFTKQAVIDKFGAPVSKVLAVSIPAPQPMHLTAKDKQTALAEHGIRKPYLVFLGTIEPRKNLITLIDAYRRLPAKLRETYDLVLAGGKGWNDEAIIDAIQTANNDGLGIITTGYVTEMQRAVLFNRAALFVLPAYYEGFGMQILEAMSYGAPTAVSDIQVFHEVCGDASIYFDQLDSVAIATCIKKLLESPKELERLREAGYKKVAEYSWAAVAEQVYNRIKELVA